MLVPPWFGWFLPPPYPLRWVTQRRKPSVEDVKKLAQITQLMTDRTQTPPRLFCSTLQVWKWLYWSRSVCEPDLSHCSFANKVLLAYNHTQLFTYYLWVLYPWTESWIVVTETIWPTKPTIFTTLPFTVKVCCPLT